MEKEKVKELPYGRYVAGNFHLDKIAVDLTEELENEMADTGIVGEVKQTAKKAGFVPYIEIGDNSGMWKSRLMFGTNMYFVFDNLDTEESGALTEDSAAFVEYIAQQMFCDCTILGDVEFIKSKQAAMDNFIQRESKREVAEETENK